MKCEQWEDLRDPGFIPLPANSVEHEPRNGVLMCRNHRGRFDDHQFYIRWVPEVRSALAPIAISRLLLISFTSHPLLAG